MTCVSVCVCVCSRARSLACAFMHVHALPAIYASFSPCANPAPPVRLAPPPTLSRSTKQPRTHLTDTENQNLGYIRPCKQLSHILWQIYVCICTHPDTHIPTRAHTLFKCRDVCVTRTDRGQGERGGCVCVCMQKYWCRSLSGT